MLPSIVAAITWKTREPNDGSIYPIGNMFNAFEPKKPGSGDRHRIFLLNPGLFSNGRKSAPSTQNSLRLAPPAFLILTLERQGSHISQKTVIGGEMNRTCVRSTTRVPGPQAVTNPGNKR